MTLESLQCVALVSRVSAKTPIAFGHEIDARSAIFTSHCDTPIYARVARLLSALLAPLGIQQEPLPSDLLVCRQAGFSPGRILIRILFSHRTRFADAHSREAFHASPDG
jgi:hypothetical protein